MAATRTLNPLPFEHLEPKRFEDLVRQLIYDFRRWRALEATGRSGGDEGFDARGIEIVEPPVDDDNEDQGDEDGHEETERLWLIQCKREKQIGPTAIVKHLNAIPAESTDGLHGLIFAAACDFSKATRDACRAWCRSKAIQEVHIWGRGEIEDQIFQPKNDNLLFAYFGISLQIRRQGLVTKIRRRITLKRRIRKIQEKAIWPGAPIILRDPSDERYPEIARKAWEGGERLWRPVWSSGVGVHGLKVIARQHYGYYDAETGEWDIASGYNHTYPHEAETAWPAPAALGKAEDIVRAWSGMPARHQMHFRFIATIPFEEIIEIDPEPDDVTELPTIFTTFRSRATGGFEPPFFERGSIELDGRSAYHGLRWFPDRHVRVFPDEMRDPEWEQNWSSANRMTLSTRRIEIPVDPEIARIQAEMAG